MQHTSCTPRTSQTAPSQRHRHTRRTGVTPSRAPRDVAGAARRRRAYDAVVSQWLIEQMAGRGPAGSGL